MALRRKLKNKRAPEGWDLIEEVVEDFEQQMKEAVNEDQDGKRKTELTWKIHRIHWEKNRFIFDLMYQRKVMSRDLVRTQHAGCSSALLCSDQDAMRLVAARILRVS
jgi:bud site selection protein 31